MSAKTLYTGIRQLVTLAGPARPRVGSDLSELAIVENAAFLVENGLITWVGSSSAAPQADDVFDVKSRGGGVVTPGLVDAHTHAAFVGSRANEFEMRVCGSTYAEIAQAGGGIKSSVRAVREASDEELAHSTANHLQEALGFGTTTIEVKSGYGLSMEDELRLLKSIPSQSPRTVKTYLGLHACPAESTKSDYVEAAICEILPEVARQDLAQYVDAYIEPGYFESSDAQWLAKEAHRFGMRVRLHVDQFCDSGGAALAAEIGAVTADHLEYTSPGGFRAMKEAGTIPVLLPASVVCLGLSKYPAAREMIDMGLPIVIASDFNPGTSPTCSLPFCMWLSCVMMKVKPAEALTASTINAAYSLGMGGEVGSIEVGKKADFVIWKAEDYREIMASPTACRAKFVSVAGTFGYEEANL